MQTRGQIEFRGYLDHILEAKIPEMPMLRECGATTHGIYLDRIHNGLKQHQELSSHLKHVRSQNRYRKYLPQLNREIAQHNLEIEDLKSYLQRYQYSLRVFAPQYSDGDRNVKMHPSRRLPIVEPKISGNWVDTSSFYLNNRIDFMQTHARFSHHLGRLTGVDPVDIYFHPVARGITIHRPCIFAGLFVWSAFLLGSAYLTHLDILHPNQIWGNGATFATDCLNTLHWYITTGQFR